MVKIKYSLIEKVSVLYLFTPTVLFCAGWLKLYFSIPIISIILIGSYLYSKNQNDSTSLNIDYFTTTYITLLSVLAVVFVIIFLSGIGGFATQDSDYGKHNRFFRDLTEYDWPLGYSEVGPDKKPLVLVSYLGYYLPSAAIGKLFGLKFTNYFSFFWAYSGVLLTLVWFCRVIGKTSFWFAMFFLFFSGLDIVGWIIMKGLPSIPYQLTPIDYWTMEQGAGFMKHAFWIFPANISILFIGPHHVLPAWMATLMVLYYGFKRKTSDNLLFLSSTCLIGSAFSSIGLLPYILIAIVYSKGKKLFTFQNIVAGPVVAIVIGLYIMSNNGDFPKSRIWKEHNMFDYLPILTLFYFLEFGLYLLISPKLDKKKSAFPIYLLIWSFVILAFAWTWCVVGHNGEFTAKGSLPSLVVLSVCLALPLVLSETNKKFSRANALKFLLILGAFSGLFLMTKSVYRGPGGNGGVKKGIQLSGIDLEQESHIDEWITGGLWYEGKQLFGEPNGSVFWDYLAAEPEMN